ncbi:hypothetical protein [Azohydromonas lata]|uniref:hypothetical protein n=1 Tax=Azohydromonas lata TaxID=45677 RepID=UPI0012F4B007|nr:hypothetical protein [Azohydromonas lata]
MRIHAFIGTALRRADQHRLMHMPEFSGIGPMVNSWRRILLNSPVLAWAASALDEASK